MRVLKWNVPVDDQIHEIGWGVVVHVQCQFAVNVLQVWTLESDDPGLVDPTRPVQVFGTGHVVPPGLTYLGTTVAASTLVWHLFGDLFPPDREKRSDE